MAAVFYASCVVIVVSIVGIPFGLDLLYWLW